MLNEEEIEIVKSFLLMPIECDCKYKGIKIHDNKIFSGILYHSGSKNPTDDPDMSDIAVRFYNTLYDLESVLIEKDGDYDFADDCIAGDTMCSFNTTANKIAGRSKNQRMPYKEWPPYLKEYYNSYHCLANFWILPKWLGRTYPKMLKEQKELTKYSKSKRGIDDYMDNYLEFIKENQTDFFEKYKSYGEVVGKDFNSFTDIHRLNGVNNYVRDSRIVRFSADRDVKNVVTNMIVCIKGRASCISRDERCNTKLFELFQSIESC